MHAGIDRPGGPAKGQHDRLGVLRAPIQRECIILSFATPECPMLRTAGS